MTTFRKDTFRKLVHSKSFGIEIETCMHPEDRRQVIDKWKGFFRFAMDGSIYNEDVSDGLRYMDCEIVSQPLPYKMLLKQLNKLNKYRFVVNHSCGIHVHVNRAMISENRIAAMLRAFRSFNHQQAEDLFGRCWNSYNDPHETDRYCSINRTNTTTIEFRMFKSGDVAWAKECLRRTKLLIEHKGDYSYESLMDLFTSPEPKKAGKKKKYKSTSLGELLRRHLRS